MNYKFLFGAITFLLLIFNNPLSTFSQIKAVTEKGDTIYVYNNGKWSYEPQEFNESKSQFDYFSYELKVDTARTSFTKPELSKKEVQNQNGQFSIYYDESKWKRVPAATLNEDAEFAFQAKESDVWCVVISEETAIEKDALIKIAKKTMEDNTGSPVTINHVEYRVVNGKPVIRGLLAANFSGISFMFDTYYYSDERGSVQFVTWSSDQIWKKNQDLIENLLNGFQVL